MFGIPVTIPVRTNEQIFPLDVVVNIDDIAVIKPLDNEGELELLSHSPDPLLPNSEIVMVDGRVLPVLETPAVLHMYLDAYKSLDEFFTRPSGLTEQGKVIPLFKKTPCATSEGSTPD